MKKLKVAVTGAAGHIGATLCRMLITADYDVRALIRNSTQGLCDLPIEKVHGDILDRNSLAELLKGCDAVVHTAGVINLGYAYDEWMEKINVEGTKNVLEVAKEMNVSKVVHVSSIHVYNQHPIDEPLHEGREFIGNDAIFYDQTKRDSHRLALEASQAGQDVVVVCPTSVLGPYDFKPSKIGKAIIDIYSGRVPAVIKGGFDFVDVRDVADGIIQAIEKGISGETYILGGTYHPIQELSRLVYLKKGKKKKLAEIPLPVIKLTLPFMKLGSYITKKEPPLTKVYLDILKDGNRHISSEKAKKELGYSTRSLETTIFDTIDWLVSHEKL